MYQYIKKVDLSPNTNTNIIKTKYLQKTRESDFNEDWNCVDGFCPNFDTKRYCLGVFQRSATEIMYPTCTVE